LDFDTAQSIFVHCDKNQHMKTMSTPEWNQGSDEKEVTINLQ